MVRGRLLRRVSGWNADGDPCFAINRLFFIMQGWGVRPEVVGDADAEADNKPLGARERNEVEGDSGKKASPITPGGNVNGWVRGD